VGNGGLILKKVSGLMIFSKKGIKKITKNYSELLGNGSFGVVYKGTLPDNTMVAVRPDHKVSKYYTENGFTDHLEIQTQMIHKNILKLIGCCLEVEIPILVYELAHAVSLEDILCAREKALPLDLRLDIAIGCAQGLRCIHSFPSEIHGDIRTDNILLDDRFTPKITGFVLSNLHVGQLRYIDPMVRHTETFIPKSDVYTFGIVLLGLISRKQSAYYECHNLIIDFREVYEKDKSGRSMFDKDIATEEDIFCLEEIGKLAIDCLKQDIEDRPDMVEVEERLVMLRRDRMLKKIGREVQHMLFSAIHSKQ
jgi:serine/threonine protein kinase